MEKIHKRTDRILNNIVNEHKMKRSHFSAANKHEPDYHDDLVDVLLKLQETSDLEFHITTNHVKAIVLAGMQIRSIDLLPIFLLFLFFFFHIFFSSKTFSSYY